MAAAETHLLFGLIALQVGLIDQAQLVAAFQAWARDKRRPLADHLADRGGPDSDGRAVIEAMVALHVKTHGGNVDESLAAVPSSRSTCASLAGLGEPDIEATLDAWPARKTAQPRRPTMMTRRAQPPYPSAPPPATASDFASCGPMRGEGSVRSSWPWIANCTARWC